MGQRQPENEDSIKEELKELAYKNRWLIENRWTVEEQQENARRVADRLLAIATGDAVEPVALTEVPHAEEFSEVAVPDFTPPEWLVKNDNFPIVGRRLGRAEFIEYVKWVQINEHYTWSPTGITMHHTGFPDLSIRPDGFAEQHMLNMRHGYINDNGWSHGPHLFIDDHGIWVFNPLSTRGVHAVSYNSTRYGIEMLGNFDNIEDLSHERGLSSRSHGMFAAAVLMKHAGISTAKLNFHRHDPETTKSCPGKHINFSDFEEEVLAIMEKV